MRGSFAEGKLSSGDGLAVAFAMSFPTAAAWLYFIAVPEGRWLPALYAVCKVVQFSFPLAWVFLVRRRRGDVGALGMRGLGTGLWSGAGIALLVFL